MKIGFQIEQMDPARGGAETYVYRLARELLSGGHEVHLLAAGFGQRVAGAFTHRIFPQGLTPWARDLRFARSAERAARRARLDVVVATGRTWGADVLQPHGGTLRGGRRQNLLRLRCPVARTLKRTFDAANPRVLTQLAIERLQYEAVPPPQVVALSRMVRADMKRFYQVPDDRLHVVYNGVDLDRFCPEACLDLRDQARHDLGLHDGETCFLLVAHNFRLKGVRELIESASLLNRQDGAWKAVIVGKGEPRPYRRLARRLGCADRWTFTGPVADVLPFYAAADVCVLPTWYDPCSLVTLEALACGRPVVTTRFNGAAELLQDGREGIVVESPDKTDSLARALQQMLDADRRRDAGPAARALAEQHSIQRNFREMMAVFEAAVAQRKEA